ncbi:ATP-dependent helicase [Vibrio chagasii]|uniref:DNA 3'-5' helicase n=1 Tax=Vibrio chagasii TaxID=170679 RepID=A0A7V7TIC7_9VIBR|nr:ATP-dependent helicase [Vibrio chagasii]KAB0482396.1 ATP-dependent helicase [Vibrio chagasii]
MKLTQSQRQAVHSNGVPTMINAGAGSGKTRVIVEKAGNLIDGGMPPERLCAITFTKKAAAEMLERLYQRVGIQAYKSVICNWHSFALNQVLKPAMTKKHPYFVKSGYTSNDLVILDESESFTLINEAANKVLSKSDLEYLKENGGVQNVQRVISFALAFGRGPKAEYHHQMDAWKGKEVAQVERDIFQFSILIWQAYYKRLVELNAVDYDHILIHAVKILSIDAKFRSWIQHHFLAVLADEHQDANPIQGLLLKLIVGDGKNLTMVGDEKQSIYGFRAADVGQLLNACTDYEGMNIIHMAENFRSSSEIVSVANAISTLMDKSQKVTDGQMIAKSGVSGTKPFARRFTNDNSEAEYTAKEINSLIQSGEYIGRDIAILYRAKNIKHSIEEHLLKLGVDYQVIGDKDFFDAKEVKDWMAFLRFCANEKDVMAASRVIDGSYIKSRGVTMRQKLIDTGMSPIDYCKFMTTQGTAKSEAKKQGFKDLIEFHETIKEVLSESGSIDDIDKLRNYELSNEELQELWAEILVGIENALLTIWQALFKPKCIAEAKKKYKTDTETAEVLSEVTTRENNVKTLNARLFKYTEQHGHLLDCIKELNLLVDSGDHQANSVQLMTEHSSKGLEFKRVYVIGCEDEAHFKGTEQDDVHEELRLFFVAATRAESDLIFSCASKRLVFGNTVPRQPLRFLVSIPPELLNWQDFSQSYGVNRNSYQSAADRGQFNGSNPIDRLREGYYVEPDLSVVTTAKRIEGFKI